MERASALYLLITLLAFYFLVPSNAVPLSRVQRMPLQEAGKMPSVKGSNLEPKGSEEKQSLMACFQCKNFKAVLMEMERFLPEDESSMITARMAFETQDYAPSGPNNHHKPPGWS